MNLARIGVKYPVTTAMFFIALVLIGLFSYFQLGLDLMPEIEMPSISVNTTYSGAAPEEVESEITDVLERYLATVADLDEIESNSREGVSSITLRFDWGTNLDEATNDVRDNLDRAKRELPDGADDPVVFKFDLAMMPIYIMGVTAEQSLPDLHDIADDDIRRQLEAIPGVASATIRGGDQRQVNIRLHLSKLNAHNIPVAKIRQVIRDSDIALPAGRIESGKFDYLLRVPERVQVEDIKNLIIKRGQFGNNVYLRDIADIEFGYAEATSEVSINRRDGIMMMVQRRSGENVVDVARRVRERLPQIEATLPPDVQIHIIRDFSEFIESTIDNLTDSLLWGGLIVGLVVLFFLGNVASSLKILTALPASLIIVFFLLHLGGYTLNVLSLSSLAIALGMVVDGAVVVLDNIDRKKKEGLDAAESALEGTGEVAKPVVASALTTISVFFPVLFVGGIVGIMFTEMAFVIILTLSVSLLCALWLMPMLSSKTRRSLTPLWLKKGFIDYGQRFISFLEVFYQKALKKVLKRPLFFLLVMGVCWVVAAGLFVFIDTRFASEADANFFTVGAELPLGSRIGVTGEVARALEELIEADVPEKEVSIKRWGGGRRGGGPMGREGSHVVWGGVRLPERLERRRSVFEIVDKLRPKADEIPGARMRFSTEDPLAGMLYGNGRPLVLELYSHDLGLAYQFAQELEVLLDEASGIYDTRISREVGRPELVFSINRVKASQLGLSVSDIAHNLRTLFEGEDLAEFYYQGKNYDINLRLRQEDRSLLDDIERVFLPLAKARPVKFSEIVKVERIEGPSVIERKNQERLLRLSADISGIGIERAVELTREKIYEVGLPEDIRYAFGGEYQEQREAFGFLFQAVIIAMILVYMVMASQFESLVHPFFILFSIPFALVGVVLILLITNTSFTVDSFVGVIMLVGIVVNNAIVLISYMNLLKDRKGSQNLIEIISEAGSKRLRPIMLTTLSTIGALMPLALQRGTGSEYWRDFAYPIIGGLSVAFLVTLFIIPAIYYLYENRRVKN